ncbi:MAG: MFS transporter [Acidimicrobiales bacterium]|nr:MAG: MFS transporter [Acidimicrobiales bacterium]
MHSPATSHPPTDDVSTTQHYFTRQPEVSSKPGIATLALPDGIFRFTTDTGVFSHAAIDAGTRFLLQHAPAVPLSGDVLDLGCGYGPVAVVWGARKPEATVWAVDTNQRALELTAANAAAAGCANVTTSQPDDVPSQIRFAAIYANPPIRIGKGALRSMLITWLDRLLPGGAAYLVVHRHLGADSLTRWLTSSGYSTQRERSSKGYRLLCVQAAAEPSVNVDQPRHHVEDEKGLR